MSTSLRLISSSFWSSRSARFSSRFSWSRMSRRRASASASTSSRRRSSSSLAARSACARAYRPRAAPRRGSGRHGCARTRPGIAPRRMRRRCHRGHRRAVRRMSSREPCPHRAGGDRPAQGDPGGQGPGHTGRPGLPHRIGMRSGRARRARRQRLKRAFPGLADGGEAVRSGGSVSISDQHRRDIGSGVSGTAPCAGGARRHVARDTETRVLSIAAIGTPPSSRAGHPSGRTPIPAVAVAGAPRAAPTAARPASSSGRPPPRGG